VSTFPKSSYDLEEVLTQLGIGEAVVTVLSERGAPTPVAWTRLRAPVSLMAPTDAAVLDAMVKASPLYAEYAEEIDRESAYERLTSRVQPAPAGEPPPAPEPAPEAPDAPQQEGPVTGGLGRVLDNPAFRSFARSAGSALGREITPVDLRDRTAARRAAAASRLRRYFPLHRRRTWPAPGGARLR
jgi:hypothetical protein